MDFDTECEVNELKARVDKLEQLAQTQAKSINQLKGMMFKKKK